MTEAEIITRRVCCELPDDLADELKILSVRLKMTQTQLLAKIVRHAIQSAPKAKSELLRLTSPFGN